MENKKSQKGALAYQVLGWVFLGMFFLAIVSIIYYKQSADLKVDTTPINHKTDAFNSDQDIVDYQGCINAGFANNLINPESCSLPDGRIFFNPNQSNSTTSKNKLGEKCPEIITSAKDPKTGEIKTYPTVCNIPVGWILIK